MSQIHMNEAIEVKVGDKVLCYLEKTEVCRHDVINYATSCRLQDERNVTKVITSLDNFIK